MKTKAWIFITALFLVAGCSNGPAANDHAGPDRTNVGTHGAGAASNLTQASSITSEAAKKTSMSMQQAANNDANWLDWLNLDNLLGRNAPGRIAAPQQPPVQNVTPRQPPAQNVTPQQPPARNANPQSSGDASRFPQQVLDLVNKERAKAGLKSLSMNNELSRMAMDKAQDMINNNYFDHQSPTYGSPFDMMNAYGISYNTAAENIAKGQRSPTEVMSSWMNSQGHRANILNGSFTQIGVAYYNGGWVQVFIG
ncbi:SCP-like extracellular [Paenibacillus antri]|uniref:SCP-like extracellular n=2 Tax=Paenibacillus antri TaxID=2582848 RepID=A0A5R9GDA5_9BACL|nr:CAP domain-containing protein [Paenibacillus antri]TLS53721.1 SCP-like extracellular [Paenibacillus antri]